MSDEEAALQRYSDDLVRAVEAALGEWVHRRSRAVLQAQGRAIDDEAARAIDGAARDATRDVTARLRELVALDIDEQRQNPLSVLRDAVAYPTQALRALGATPVERDEFDRRTFPDDDFALTPAAFADFGPTVHEAGLAWGAAKAYVHLRRRAAE
jgi:hypothetical protein